MIKLAKPNIDTEYILLGSMIMDKDVLATCHTRYKLKELKTRHFTEHYRPVVRWLMKYYADFGKAPKGTIQKIYQRKKRSLSEESRELIEQALDKLAEEYAKQDEPDTDYVLQEVLINFIREREIDALAEKAIQRLDAGDAEAAEEIITGYTTLEPEEELDVMMPYTREDTTHNWDNPNDPINEVYRFDGDLHYMVGPLERGWLVAVTGVEKVGKSYLLQEMAFQAALYQKRKVLIINLELTENIARNRLRRRISLTTNMQQRGRIVYPVLDCENNQFATCEIRKRSKKALFRTTQDTVSFRRMRDWKVCEKCRGKLSRRNAARTKRFVPAIWFEQDRIRELNRIRLRRALKTYRLYGMSNLRVKCFPRFSKTFDETRDFIKRYIDREGWEPDIVIYDYLDILAPEGRLDERIDVDRKWKKAAKLAGELNCLVVTADQANKAGRTQRSLDQMSTSESKTKDSHLDVRIAINQTESEKKLNIARLAVIFHRHSPFNITDQVVVTQRLATAESLMDNAFWHTNTDKYRVQVEKL